MNTHPILFSAPMVRAIWDGSKTQTRRVVQPQPENLEGEIVFPWATFYANGYVMTHDRDGVGGQNWDASDLPDESKYNEALKRTPYENPCPYGKPGDLLIPAIEIDGYEGKYAAGIDGRIYSRARGYWRALKEWQQPKGYSSVTLMATDGRKQSLAVHRLVCAAFYGPKPSTSHEVRHLDGNPENGSPENLAWGTRAENWQDRKAHGNGVEGEKHHDSKFSNEDRDHIRWAIEYGLCSQRHAARALGVSQCAIQGISGFSANPTEQDIPSGRIPTLTLEITDVRVERVESISEGDAIQEGLERRLGMMPEYRGAPSLPWRQEFPRDAFRELWDSINAKRGYGWDVNPWVWALTFKAHRMNVDALMRELEAA